MKKLLSGVLAMTMLLSMSGLASATKDTSFTSDSTAGIFEDNYDFFKYSPAYLPSLQRNTLWAQLSNHVTGGDEQVNGNPGTSSYLLGTQVSAMGVGRAGFIFDWYGSDSFETAYNGYAGGESQSGNGFIESALVNYRDSNTDGIYDAKTEKYGREKRTYSYNDTDVYVAYGLGDLGGLDFGAALRVQGSGTKYTYNPGYLGVNALVAQYAGLLIGPSFDQSLRWTETNLITGAKTFEFTQGTTGSLERSSMDTKVTLAARAAKMISNLDAVVNLTPIFRSRTNKYTYQLDQNINYNPNAVADKVSQYKENGIENGLGYPGSGVGVGIGLRGDYTMSSNFVLIGEGGFQMVPSTIADAKQDRTTMVRTRTPNGTLLQVDQTDVADNDKFEGKTDDSSYSLGVRGQYQVAKNTKFGMGIKFTGTSTISKVKTTNTYSSTRTVSGTGSTATDYTAVTTGGYTSEANTRSIYNNIELPVGLVINLMENLPIRFGAMHTITTHEYSNDTQVTARQPQITQTNYANGSSAQTAATQNNFDEVNSGYLQTYHNNALYHGATWWPTKDVQVDMTAIYDLVKFGDYRLSISVYF